MEKTARKFRSRTFVDLMLTVCALGLPITGIANHVYGFSGLTVPRHAWMSAHNVLALLFTACVVWHIGFNRRALWQHLRGIAGVGRLLGREALAVVGVLALGLLFVFHAFHAGG